MGGKRASYLPQLRAEAIELVKGSGRPIKQIVEDLGVCVDTLRS
jgi:transposase-like protein